MLQLWKHRNDLEHGEKSVYSATDIKSIMSLVDMLYNKYENVLCEENHKLFDVPRYVRKQKDIPGVIAWIEMVLNLYVRDGDMVRDANSGAAYVRTNDDENDQEINIRYRACI